MRTCSRSEFLFLLTSLAVPVACSLHALYGLSFHVSLVVVSCVFCAFACVQCNALMFCVVRSAFAAMCAERCYVVSFGQLCCDV